MSVEDEHGYHREERERQKAAEPPQAVIPAWYSYQIGGVTFDFYRLAEALRLKHHAQTHALKKVIRAGASEKPVIQDIDEAIKSLQRWKEMILEDRTGRSPVLPSEPFPLPH